MQYISPFSLLETIGIQYLTYDNLPLAKKMLLAELELLGSSTIFIKGRELTKNDILVLFDGRPPKNSQHNHEVIAGDPSLRRFLEDCVLENGDRFKNENPYNDPQFIEWLSPYYFTSFSKLSAECISAKLYEKWECLLSNPMLMTPVWIEKAWAAIEALVRKDLGILHSFNNQKRVKVKHGLEPLISPQYIAMLQLLPDERFWMLKDEYGYLMMQCSIHIYNKINKQAAISIITRALPLAVSAEIRQAIETAGVGLYKHYRYWQKGKQDRIARRIAFGGVLIFIIYTFWKSWSDTGITDNENGSDSTMYKIQPSSPAHTFTNTDSVKSSHRHSKYGDTTTYR